MIARPNIRIAVLFAAAAMMLVFASSAAAEFAFAPDGVKVSTTQSDGVTPLTQAGAHPDFTTAFELQHEPAEGADGNLKDFEITLPPGLVGNANAPPKCTAADATTVDGCAADTQVGTMTVTEFSPDSHTYLDLPTTPVYNVEPQDDEPAAFATTAGGYPVRIDTRVGPAEGYRVHASASALQETVPIVSSTLVLWGVPSDHTGAGARRPLMTNPTSCTGQPLTADAAADSWINQNVFAFMTASMDPTTGCDKLRFEPSISVRPDSLTAGAPAGYGIDIDVPQSDDPDGLASPTLKDAKVVLPEGVVLSPSVAHGLQGVQRRPAGDHV